MKFDIRFKIGGLVILLMLPIFIIMFLHFFGENHYRIPIYYPSIEQDFSANPDTIYHTIPTFKMVSQKSDSIYGLSDKITVVDFFFTRCAGICPKMTANLTKVQATFEKDSDVELVSVSVDPEYDTPEVLNNYANKFGIIYPKWKLLNGSKLDVYQLGFYGFKLPSDTVDKTLHSEKAVLVDKDRRIRGYYNATDTKEIDRLITEIKILKYEYERGTTKN